MPESRSFPESLNREFLEDLDGLVGSMVMIKFSLALSRDLRDSGDFEKELRRARKFLIIITPRDVFHVENIIGALNGHEIARRVSRLFGPGLSSVEDEAERLKAYRLRHKACLATVNKAIRGASVSPQEVEEAEKFFDDVREIFDGIHLLQAQRAAEDE